MKKKQIWILFTSLLATTSCSSMQTQEEKELLSDTRITHTGSKISVSVVQFENRSATSDRDACRGWFDYPTVGSALSERLITALGKYEKFDVLERETISKILENEHDLRNSKPMAAADRNQFERARYALVGVVTSFELCAENLDVGAVVSTFTGFGGGGAGRAKAKVQVQLRAVDTKTGRIVATAKGEGEQVRGGFDVFGAGSGAGGGLSFSGKNPLGTAIDLAIGKALKEIEPKLGV